MTAPCRFTFGVDGFGPTSLTPRERFLGVANSHIRATTRMFMDDLPVAQVLY